MAIPALTPNPQVPASLLRPLDRAFYARDPRRVARELLGKVLVRQEARRKVWGEARGEVRRDARREAGTQPTGRIVLTGRIVEVEAYLAEKDPAAHAFAGRTRRNAVLFGPPGYAYVYFIYGNHYCLNVSCEQEGKGGGVLFRALEPLSGMEAMARARGISLASPKDFRNLTSGPGRLAEAFGITRDRDNGADLTIEGGTLWIADDGYRARGIRATPRIGIVKAADRPLRYILGGNPYVSGPKSWGAT